LEEKLGINYGQFVVDDELIAEDTEKLHLPWFQLNSLSENISK